LNVTDFRSLRPFPVYSVVVYYKLRINAEYWIIIEVICTADITYLHIKVCTITSYHKFSWPSMAFLPTCRVAATVVSMPFCIIVSQQSIWWRHYLACLANSRLVSDVRGKSLVVRDKVWRRNIFHVQI